MGVCGPEIMCGKACEVKFEHFVYSIYVGITIFYPNDSILLSRPCHKPGIIDIFKIKFIKIKNKNKQLVASREKERYESQSTNYVICHHISVK